jgi:hypothetical protein
MRIRDESDSDCASNCALICDGEDKRSGEKAWAIHGKSNLTKTEIGETGEEQS